VRLDQTLRFEEEIACQENSIEETDRGVIIVNERRVNHSDINSYEDHCIRGGEEEEEKWKKRLKKVAINPVSLVEAKRKLGGPVRFQVKPKNEVQKETEHHLSEKFRDLVDTKSTGILGSFIYNIWYKDGYEKNVTWGGWAREKEVRYIPKFMKKMYCPPEHWVTPVVQWVRIWTKIDELEKGYKRDYVYVPEGKYCDDSYIIAGPAIHFFDNKELESIEDYENYWQTQTEKVWITANSESCWRAINDSTRLSDTSYLTRGEKTYIENPSVETFRDYQDRWRATQPEYEGYYSGGSNGWQFKVMLSDHKRVDHKRAPHPHL